MEVRGWEGGLIYVTPVLCSSLARIKAKKLPNLLNVSSYILMNSHKSKNTDSQSSQENP